MPVVRDRTERFGAEPAPGTTQFASPETLGGLLGQLGGRGVQTQPTTGPFTYPPMLHAQTQPGGAVQNAGMMADLLAKYGPIVAGQMLADINGLGEGGSLGGGAGPGTLGPGTQVTPWFAPVPQPAQQPGQASGTAVPTNSPRVPSNKRGSVATTPQATPQAAQSADLSGLMGLGSMLAGMQQPQAQPQAPVVGGAQQMLQSLFGQSPFGRRM